MTKFLELTSPRSQLPCTVTRASPGIQVSLLQLTHLICFMVQVGGKKSFGVLPDSDKSPQELGCNQAAQTWRKNPAFKKNEIKTLIAFRWCCAKNAWKWGQRSTFLFSVFTEDAGLWFLTPSGGFYVLQTFFYWSERFISSDVTLHVLWQQAPPRERWPSYIHSHTHAHRLRLWCLGLHPSSIFIRWCACQLQYLGLDDFIFSPMLNCFLQNRRGDEEKINCESVRVILNQEFPFKFGNIIDWLLKRTWNVASAL